MSMESAPVAAPAAVTPGLLEAIKLVVWDFDLTVLQLHAWGNRISPAEVATRNMSTDFADLEGFKQIVEDLKGAGVEVAVASFGAFPTIEAYLDRVFPEHYFTRENISTPSVVGSIDGYHVEGGKNKQLALLCEKYGAEPGQVLFFDDDASNVSKAVEAGYVHSFHTPDAFTRPVWMSVLEKFEGDGAAPVAAPVADAPVEEPAE